MPWSAAAWTGAGDQLDSEPEVAAQDIIVKHFYIAGCQRSGTTLMRLVLECHSRLSCFDEADSYRLLIGKPPEAAHAEVDLATVDGIGFKIPRFAEQLLDAEMADVDYGRFPTFYRGDPVIFLRRDVLDVVASMQTLTYPDGQTWLSRYGRRILLARCEIPAVRDRYAAGLERLAAEGFPDHLVGALYWRFKTEAAGDYARAGLPVLEVDYETLVADPEPVLQRVVAFLGMPFEIRLLQHPSFAHRELDADGKAIGGTDPSLPIHARSVGRHRAVFTAGQVDGIREIALGRS